MFKKLRKAIARRRDMRLRKWCVKHLTKIYTVDDIEYLYHFVTEARDSRK